MDVPAVGAFALHGSSLQMLGHNLPVYCVEIEHAVYSYHIGSGTAGDSRLGRALAVLQYYSRFWL